MEIELDIIRVGMINIVLIKADIASNMIDFQCESPIKSNGSDVF